MDFQHTDDRTRVAGFGRHEMRTRRTAKFVLAPMTGSKVAITLLLTLMTTTALADSRGPVTLVGHVSSGGSRQRVPIRGAKITVYQAGNDQALATGRSNAQGAFDLPVTYNPKGGILYAVARKGRKVELRAIIGEGIAGPIVVNEMTTVASAYSLVRILQEGSVPASPKLPARIAAGMADNLVSAATGMPSAVMQDSPNANETNAWRLLGTLANILANCVRDSGHACGRLFALATPPGGAAAPATTWQATLNIARNPAANVKRLFALGEPTKVFEPNLTTQFGPDAPNKFKRLDAFTLAIKFNASGQVDANGHELCPFGGPGNFVFDTNGYVWITNNVVQGTISSTNCMIVLKPDGRPADGQNAAGNLWVTNNWKPDFVVDLTSNPGGDAMVVFVGLAAPVKPVLYSAPPVSPFD